MVSAPRIGQVLPSTSEDRDPIPPTYIPELVADKIASGEITGAVIAVGDDGVIKAGLGSTTVELVKEGLFGYVDNQLVFRLADGELFVKGTIEADDGYFSGELNGAHIFGSSIDASTITGGSITIGSDDAVFRASQLGIQLGSGDWLTAPFKVDTTGRLTANNATISGTVRTAENGGRVVMTRTTDIWNNQVGRIELWGGIAGEQPASLTQRRSGQSSGNQLVVDGGYDPIFSKEAPKIYMSVKQRVGVPTPPGQPEPSYAEMLFVADQTEFRGPLKARNPVTALAFTAVATHWSTVDGDQVKAWRDVDYGLVVQGTMRTLSALSSGTVVATLPSTVLLDLTPLRTRSILGLVNGVTPMEFEYRQNGDLVCMGSIAADARVVLTGHLPPDQADVSAS